LLGTVMTMSQITSQNHNVNGHSAANCWRVVGCTSDTQLWNWVVNHVGDDVVFEWCHWSQDCSHSLLQLHLPSSTWVPCSPECVPKKPLWLYSNFFKQTFLCWEFSRSKVSFLFLSGLLLETMAVLTKCGLLGFMCSGYHLRISFTKLHKEQIHLSLPKIWTNMTYISFFQKQLILIGRVKQSGAQVRFKHIYTKGCSWKNGQH
jgi:hypothetical protein